MKHAVMHIIEGSLSRYKWNGIGLGKDIKWEAACLFYAGGKWQLGECNFVDKPEFDRPHKIFNINCLRIKEKHKK